MPVVKIFFLVQMLKNLIKNVFLSLKGDSLLREFNRTPRILFWHGVDNIVNKSIEAETFDTESFKKQITYLNKYYEIISLDEFYKRYQSKKFTNREVVLTFDDGYANNLNVVFPILSNLNLPFTVFVSTEHIETGEIFPTSIARLMLLGAGLKIIDIPFLRMSNTDISVNVARDKVYHIVVEALKTKPLSEVKTIVNELKANITKQEYITLIAKYNSVKPMNWDEVIKLHQLGATIGSHCKYHICCHENQEQQEVKEQIIESKQILEQKLQTECKFFAYPNGNYTPTSNSYVKAAGYTMGFSTDKYKKIEIVNEISIIPRIGVPLNVDTFKIFVNLYPRK